jgi:alpha-aminoadipate carrier protein LysW
MYICVSKGAAKVSEIKTRVIRADCPDCGSRIAVHSPVRIGQQVRCPNCDAELEVIDTNPVELDWVYEDEEGEEDEDEDW